MTEPGAAWNSTSYERLDNGGSRLVVATLEDGAIVSLEFGPEETLRNLQAWAGAMGLVIAYPLL